MDEWLYEDINFLNDIYCLESMHFATIQDSMRIRYLYETTGDLAILTEGFSDIVSSMGKFFKTMIEKIKEFFKKVLMKISSYFMDIDKFCAKYKTELDKITNVDFDIRGFEFTLHDEPNMEPFHKIVDDYNAGLSDAVKMKVSDIVKEQNAYLATDNLNRLRGVILGNNSPIMEEDFLEEIRKYYRKGEIDTVEVHVDTTMFRDIVRGSSALMKEKKEAERTRDTLISLLQKTENFFNKKVPTVYDSKGNRSVELRSLSIDNNKVSVSGNELKTISGTTESIDRFVRFKYNQVKEISSMVNLVATERVNAYKDKVKMHREIIQKALFDKSTTTEIDDAKEV